MENLPNIYFAEGNSRNGISSKDLEEKQVLWPRQSRDRFSRSQQGIHQFNNFLGHNILEISREREIEDCTKTKSQQII